MSEESVALNKSFIFSQLPFLVKQYSATFLSLPRVSVTRSPTLLYVHEVFKSSANAMS